MKFFVGLHHPSVAWAFRNVMISVNCLFNRKKSSYTRKSHFLVNDWILDSGAFSQISQHGRFVISEDEYLERINFFSGCGSLLAAVVQDWMCEDFILEKTGKSVEEHQELTIASFFSLSQKTKVAILPVLQGFSPASYVSHVRQYGSLLGPECWVGVGSVCRRNGNPDAIEDVLLAIKSERSDLRLHGFGLKKEALERPTVRALLVSSDSMAWCLSAELGRDDSNDPRAALRYAAKVEAIIKEPCLVQEQLFQWWSTGARGASEFCQPSALGEYASTGAENAKGSTSFTTGEATGT